MRPTDDQRSWPALLTRLLDGDDLAAADTGWVMDQLMAGDATPAQLAAFAVALRAKGETAAEVAGLADSMLSHAVPMRSQGRSVDIVGTGGDRSNTVNISTMAAVVIAAAGAPVVKHGNRAASSKCGSADLLEAMGVALHLGPAGVQTTVTELGIGFCFAPVFHPSFRHAGAPRREMGIPTVFNFLGPLTNPAHTVSGAIGCGSAVMAPIMAEVFAGRGGDVLLFRGDDGLDELTTTTTSTIWVVSGGKVVRTTLDPERLDIPAADPADLVGGEVAVNLAVAQDLLAGKPGAVRDAVLLNAAAALAAHAGLSDVIGPADAAELSASLHTVMAAELERAAAAIDSGAAQRLAADWAARSTELAAQQ
ncbi:anthranilate phosphoribosyltransferase [Nakamurella aerolata]|uniref:Anthranilate phosphoribosyltransferase n=1 Tax=Nakamurella aerolata TaxID=1656892 RepID=A0A849A288_9ACTN|nr:anthranilate phosphoribosyltransferase [Nakamurella aerolata]NNG34665.1 anthranilate phosphoribosyltransferase [Nakamurella aerolata]